MAQRVEGDSVMAAPELPWRLWELDISTFRGISFNAEHYYANFSTSVTPKRKVSVERLLTEEYADVLTAKDPSYTWRVGTSTNRYDTKEEATAAALVAWRHVAGEGDVLVMDRHAYTDEPVVVLAGPPDVMAMADIIWEQSRETDWWKGTYDNWDALNRHWEVVLKQHGIDTETGTHGFIPGEVERIDVVVKGVGTTWEIGECDDDAYC